MTDLLLTSKITLPTPQSGNIERNRLSGLLQTGLAKRVISVYSPAGFGKTTAVSSWCNEIKDSIRIAWLSLDAADNEISRFAAYFVSAFAAQCNDIDDEIRNIACSGKIQDMEPLFIRLLTELNKTTTKESNGKPLIFVLDDYHVIDNIKIHEALKLFLRHLPEQMTAVIISRSEPALGLSFLRVSGQLLEIGENALSFNEKEANTFFDQRLDFVLSKDVVRKVLERLEGWAAGLQLMTLSITDAESFKQASEDFTGRDKHVFDYLADDVLARLSDELREFLLLTSILDRFDAELASAVSGISESLGLLTYLEKNHVFIVPLDRERKWYRYHHLFSDFLRHQLLLDGSYDIKQLHQSACDAWITKGDFTEAVKHAIEANDDMRIFKILEKEGWNLFERGQNQLLNRCLDSLPVERAASSGTISVLKVCRAINIDRELDSIEPFLQTAEKQLPQLLPENEWRQVSAAFSAMRALNGALAVDDVDKVEKWARFALENLAQSDMNMRVCAMCALGVVNLDQGKLDKAIEILLESQLLAESTGAIQMAIRSLYLQNYIRMSQGNFDQAYDIQEQAISLCNEYCTESESTLDFIMQSRAWLHWELLELEKSEEICHQALQRRKEVLKFPIHTQLSFIRFVQNDIEGAAYYVAQNDSILQQYLCRRRWLCDHYEVKVSLWARMAKLDELENWLNEQNPIVTPANIVSQSQGRSQVRAYLALDLPQKALPLLDNLINVANKVGLVPDESKAQAWKSVAHSALEEKEQAITAMKRSLTLAAQSRCIGSLLEIGEFLMPTLEVLVDEGGSHGLSGDESRLARQLFRHIEQWSKTDSRPGASDIPESARLAQVTRKEWQVLSMIGDGLSNAQIANRMFISPGTVKCHINRLYRKLDISTRDMAIKKTKQFRELQDDYPQHSRREK
jgi:LuxR family transcriptional regulator, maltose regulon positive regulatory protein